ncbi:murein biosynthesis integral membrane protein MurJ [Candidatus Zinderia endosymbiont of Aphrophora alni]|uniref:murein biosynthesis integral membrane protein MurJ n=1 Tax=Candidatus Zinderia endosymbiont of Aphrophora alni TaxID=3077951 RepID=UPI0030D0EB3C
MYKSFFFVLIIVFLIRVISFLREIVFAHNFGVSIYTDAFNISFRILNLVCRIFSEDIFSQTFIPIIIEYKNKRKYSFLKIKKIINDVTTILMWLSFFVVILSTIFSLTIVKILLIKTKSNKKIFFLSSNLIKIMLPFIYCSSYIAISRCILNIYNNIKISTISLIIINILFIISIYVVTPIFNCPIYGVGFSIFFSGIIQILFQIPFLRKIGILPKIYFNFFSSLKNKKATYIFKKVLTPIISYSILQLNLLLNIKIASKLKEGSVSWLFYSDRLIEFPLALICGVLYTIILPILSKVFFKKNNFIYYTFFDYTLRLVFLLIFPLQIFFFTLSVPIISTLFFYNKFDINSVFMTSKTLNFYSLGLTSLLINKVFLINFFINKDKITPIKFSLFIMIVSQILNYFLVPYLGHIGFSLSTAITNILSNLFLLFIFNSKKKKSFEKGWFTFFLKIIIALIIMLIFEIIISNFFNWFNVKHPLERIMFLTFIFISSIFVYLFSLFFLNFNFIFFKKILKFKK